jgi:hypothetical protein
VPSAGRITRFDELSGNFELPFEMSLYCRSLQYRLARLQQEVANY